MRRPYSAPCEKEAAGTTTGLRLKTRVRGSLAEVRQNEKNGGAKERNGSDLENGKSRNCV